MLAAYKDGPGSVGGSLAIGHHGELGVTREEGWKHPLEIVRPLLPGPVAFNPNFHTSEYHLLSSTKVNAQLHNVSVLDGE